MKEELEKYKALSQITRLRIMRLFTEFDGELCTCEIMDALEKPQYDISKNLNILRRAGLLKERRVKKLVMYELKRDNKFNRTLVKNIKEINIHDKSVFSQDSKRLGKRLKLRKEGRCIVTYKHKCIKG